MKKSQLSFISSGRAIVGSMLESNTETDRLATNNAELGPNNYTISTGQDGIAKMNIIIASLILRTTMHEDG